MPSVGRCQRLWTPDGTRVRDAAAVGCRSALGMEPAATQSIYGRSDHRHRVVARLCVLPTRTFAIAVAHASPHSRSPRVQALGFSASPAHRCSAPRARNRGRVVLGRLLPARSGNGSLSLPAEAHVTVRIITLEANGGAGVAVSRWCMCSSWLRSRRRSAGAPLRRAA